MQIFVFGLGDVHIPGGELLGVVLDRPLAAKLIIKASAAPASHSRPGMATPKAVAVHSDSVLPSTAICGREVSNCSTVGAPAETAPRFLTAITGLNDITASAKEPTALAAAVVGLGVLGTGFRLSSAIATPRPVSALNASTVTCIPPAVAMLGGVGVLGEPLHVITIAVALILGAAVTSRAPSRSTRRTEERAVKRPGPPSLIAMSRQSLAGRRYG